MSQVAKFPNSSYLYPVIINQSWMSKRNNSNQKYNNTSKISERSNSLQNYTSMKNIQKNDKIDQSGYKDQTNFQNLKLPVVQQKFEKIRFKKKYCIRTINSIEDDNKCLQKEFSTNLKTLNIQKRPLNNCKKIVCKDKQNAIPISKDKIILRSLVNKISPFKYMSKYPKKPTNLAYDYTIYKINICNGIFIRPNNKKTNIYIGKGNNCKLVQNILKTRSHFQIVKNIAQANIIWAQRQIPQYYTRQQQKQWVSYRSLQSQGLISKQYYQLYETLEQAGIFSQSSNQQLSNFLHRNYFLAVFQPKIIQNHISGHRQLSDKKNLYLNLKAYSLIKNVDLTSLIPKTFLSSQRKQIQQYINEKNQDVWIVKPSQNSNRGRGISIILNKSKLLQTINSDRNLIIQQYITNCLLYNRRKFDIRTYLLIANNGKTPQFYIYNGGYVRLCSNKFDLTSNCQFVHLTNDAIQAKGDQYSKYELCNKISLTALERYIQMINPYGEFTLDKFYSKAKNIMKHALSAAMDKIINNTLFNFEIFGLDFMIDQKLDTYLIEVNTNPCLDTNCPLLQRVIPTMLQQSFRIAIDPLFIKSSSYFDQTKSYDKGKYQPILI